MSEAISRSAAQPVTITVRPEVARFAELMEQKLEQGEVWNVNFPALRTRPLMGILRDRPVAPVSMFFEEYIPETQPDGSVVLTIKGTPTADSNIPAGTDAEAVRRGYISISRIRAFF